MRFYIRVQYTYTCVRGRALINVRIVRSSGENDCGRTDRPSDPIRIIHQLMDRARREYITIIIMITVRPGWLGRIGAFGYSAGWFFFSPNTKVERKKGVGILHFFFFAFPPSPLCINTACARQS